MPTLTHIDIDIQDERKEARVLSLLNRERTPHQVEKKQVISEEERVEARERIMREGSQTLDVKEMLEWLKEFKQDCKMPFRNDE